MKSNKMKLDETNKKIFNDLTEEFKLKTLDELHEILTENKDLTKIGLFAIELVIKRKMLNSFLIWDKENHPIKVDIDSVTDYLLEKLTIKTIYWERGESVYIYKKGVWLKHGREIIFKELENILLDWCKNNVNLEIFNKIKRRTIINKDDFFETKKGFVCLENGVYDLDNHIFLEHDPKYYFKSKLNINYNENAKCPKIIKFLSEVIFEDDLNFIQEWIGFSLLNEYKHKRALILLGETDTGKSVFLNLIIKFIDESNVSNLSLQEICFGKSFRLLNLKDKLVNIHDDLDSGDLVSVGKFKIATGGGFLSGELKFGDTINFKNYGKLMFATNKIPLPKEKDFDDTAYFKRWFVIKFENQIEDNKQDINLLEKLTTPDELTGFFNWGIEGLKRLQKNNMFSYDRTPTETKEIMQRSGHTLSNFTNDCLIKSDKGITKDKMYILYSWWCEKNKQSRFTKDKFGKQILRFANYIINGKIGGDRAWLNCEINDFVLKQDSYNIFSKVIYNINKSSNENNIYGFEKDVIGVIKKTENTQPKIEEIYIKDEIKPKPLTNIQTGYLNKLLRFIKSKDLVSHEDLIDNEFKEEWIQHALKVGGIFEVKAGYYKLLE